MYLVRNKGYYEALRERHLPPKLKFWNERKFGKITISSSTLLIENYSQNQWNYLQINSKQTESSKTKKSFFPVTFSTNPNKIKLQMLQEGLKCKQLE